MTFPDFQRQMEWCQSYFTKVTLKAHTVIGSTGTVLPMVIWCVANVGHYYLNISMHL